MEQLSGSGEGDEMIQAWAEGNFSLRILTVSYLLRVPIQDRSAHMLNKTYIEKPI